MKQFLSWSSGYFIGTLIFEWFSQDRITGGDALCAAFVALFAGTAAAGYAQWRSRGRAKQAVGA